MRQLTTLSCCVLMAWASCEHVLAHDVVSALATDNDRQAQLEQQVADLQLRLARLESAREKVPVGQAASVGSLPRDGLLCFNAPWAGPCQQMKPIQERLKAQGFPLREINVDSERKLVAQFHIESVPTYVFLKDGLEVSRQSGMTSENVLRARLLRLSPPKP